LGLLNKKSARPFLIIMLILATIGSILFFPMRLDKNYTCLYHRLFDTHLNIYENGQHQADIASGDSQVQEVDTDKMIQFYLIRYAFFWWLSLGGVFVAVYLLRRYRKEAQQEFL